MSNKWEIVKRFFIGIAVTGTIIFLSIYKKQKVDWVDIMLWAAPLFILIVMIVYYKINKK